MVLGALFVAQVHAGLVFVGSISTEGAGFGPEGITVDPETGEILFVGSENFKVADTVDPDTGETLVGKSVSGTSTLVRITADGFLSTQIDLDNVGGIHVLDNNSYRVASNGEEIKYNFEGDTGYQSSMSYSKSGVGMVVTAHEVVNNDMGGTSNGDNSIFEVRDAPVSESTGVYDSASGLGASSYESDGEHDVDGSDTKQTVGLVDHYIHDEGLLFTFQSEVELASIDFNTFDSVNGADDFNLTVDGVTYLMDHHSDTNSEYVVSNNGDDVFDFQNVSGTEFLFWLDDDADDWRVDDVTIAVDNNGLFKMDGDGTVDFERLFLDITAESFDLEDAEESDEPHGVFAFPDGSSARGETTPGGLIWVADDPRERVYTVNSDGELQGIINTESIYFQLGEPEGIEIDPISGNLLIADDTGLGRVYELTLEGELVQAFNMAALTTDGFTDPEGLFVQLAGAAPLVGLELDLLDSLPSGPLLLVAFDNDEAIGIFSIEPGTAGSSHLPEPGTLALLFAAVAGTLLVPRRHRRSPSVVAWSLAERVSPGQRPSQSPTRRIPRQGMRTRASSGCRRRA